LSGLPAAFARENSSFTFFAGLDGFTTSTSGDAPMKMIDWKSYSES
jgi:hypothetical protein